MSRREIGAIVVCAIDTFCVPAILGKLALRVAERALRSISLIPVQLHLPYVNIKVKSNNPIVLSLSSSLCFYLSRQQKSILQLVRHFPGL